jgi:N5-hydroxy-L-ornithine N5-transacylase
MASAADSPGFQAANFDIPREQSFTLPDGKTWIKSIQNDESTLTISVGENVKVSLHKQEKKLRTSPPGIVNDDRAEHAEIWLLKNSAAGKLGAESLWSAIYDVWIRNYEKDVLPFTLCTETVSDASDLTTYLIHTGLAYTLEDGATELLLIRATFWQSAGSPPSLAWLRSPVPSLAISPLNPSIFPLHTSFTRGTNVATTHPLRPPKPAPGAVIYSRYIFALNEHLTFTHINGDDPRHFEAYSRWQNSDRVNVGWRERGDDEHHRKYIRDRLADKHIMGFMVEWNGELAGYGEIAWVKEDHLGTFVGGLGDWDQGTHLLIGEDKFRGKHRCKLMKYSETEIVC